MAGTTDKAQPPQPGGWTVGTQVQRTARNTLGQFVPGWDIHFVTSSGIAGSVWVSDTDYNPSTIRELIASKAAIIDQVQGLSG
jgi:hypothetical protein